MLEILNITKKFPESNTKNASTPGAAVSELSLVIKEGEFFSLLGPSGCGKTTLLRMIAGLENPTSGEIRFRGQRVDHLTPQARPFNMIFQKYALFPHMSVFENVAFGLKVKKLAPTEIIKKVNETLNLVNLNQFADRFPETLSGGQCQRVAIARALVNEPKILLLDEPLSALDLKLREHMQTELKALQKKLGLTFIYVTHDQEEALALSDRIGVMNSGRLEQVSRPEELYRNPETLFSAQFVGSMSSFTTKVVGQKDSCTHVQFGEQSFKASKSSNIINASSLNEVMAFIRPEKLKLSSANTQAALGSNSFEAKIHQTVFRGTEIEVHLSVNPSIQSTSGCSLKALIKSDEQDESLLQNGTSVMVSFEPQDLFLFARS